MTFPKEAVIRRGGKYTLAVPFLPNYPGLKDFFIEVEADEKIESLFDETICFDGELLNIACREFYLCPRVSIKDFEGVENLSGEDFERAKKRVLKKSLNTEWVKIPYENSFFFSDAAVSGNFKERLKSDERYKKLVKKGDVVEGERSFELKVAKTVPPLAGSLKELKKVLKTGLEK